MKKSLIVIFCLLCFLLVVFPIISSMEENTIHIKEMERVFYDIFQIEGYDDLKVEGYLLADGLLSRLPIGTILDKEKGIFYWLPGPGFLGEYEILFKSATLGEEKKVKINISPKYGEILDAKVHSDISRVAVSNDPFGSFDTPVHGSTVASSIAVTGWALDDIGVESVKIYRGEPNNMVYIGSAVFIEGARPDVEQAYPDYPMNYRAGWGYMMLTNFLPNGGNGTFKIHAIATDAEGHQVTLGTKTIIVDNANAVKPFGAIDTPTQGGTATGSSFINWGWVLTPQPNCIPTDGSTINVYVDGVNLGHPTYNIYRADIATLFPDYCNRNGAVGYFYIDTTAYENGVHTIQWTATDNAGNTDGIGSRYFTIKNTTPGGADAVVLSESTTNKVTNVSGDGSTITFSTDADQISDLEQGDFIVSGVSKHFPNGILKEVKSVNSTSNSYVIKTENAALENVIQNVDIHQTVQLVSSDIMRAKTADNVYLKRSSVTNEISLELFHAVLYDFDGDPLTTDDQVTLDGDIKFTPELDFHLEIVDWELKEFRSELLVTSNVEVISTADLKFDNLNASLTLFDHYFSPVVFMAGPIPVVVLPKVEIIASINGEVTAYFQFGAGVNIKSSSGVKYSNGYWSNSSSLDQDFYSIGPTIDSSLNAKGQVGPRFTLLFYGIAGPYFSVNAYAELDANINEVPWWRLYGGFNVFGGVVIEMLSRKLADYSVEIIDFKVELANSGGSGTDQYTLEVTRGVGVNGTPSSGSTKYSKGDTVNYSYSLQNGFTDLRVTLDGSTVPASGTITMDKDHTLNATATPQIVTTYKLIVTKGTGVDGTPISGVTTHNEGTTVNYSYSLKSGYINLQVTLDGKPVSSSGTITMDQDHTLNATATPQIITTYKLTVTKGTGVDGTPISGVTTHNEGINVSYSYSLQDGYTDLHVSLDGATVPASGTITMDQDHTLNATATPQGVTTYKLTVTRGVGVDGTPDSGETTYNEGTTVNYSYSLQSGFTNLVVNLDGNNVANSGTITMDSDHTLIAGSVPSIEWINVPAGEFQMGDNFGDSLENDEVPVHTVYLSTYKISKYEVTFDQYDAFCDDTGRSKPSSDIWGRETRPVINVSWNDAKAFCDWLSQKTGENIHLPTEAQWEKAARGTDQRRYPWGNSSPTCSVVNYAHCQSKTMPVGSYPGGISYYGVHDMAGNVYEWCKDWYSDTYYSSSPYSNPQGPSSGSCRVLRGGDYWHNDYDMRSAHRYCGTPVSARKWIGFRIAMN